MTEAYVELHARSAFSFLEGASVPEDLAGACAEFGMPAMALVDRNGVYGAPRFHMAAKKAGIRAHIGSEITCTNGRTYPLLVETREGYQNLCRLVTRMKLRAKKGEGAATLDELAEFARGLICLTRHPDARLLEIFGQAQRLRRAPAPPPSRRGSAQPGHCGMRAPPRHPAGRHQRRRLRHARAARAARRLHLRAPKNDARRPPAGCWSATPSATSRRPPRWRASSPTCPRPSPTRSKFLRASSSPWPTSATNSRATPCPRAKRRCPSCANAWMKARAAATSRITSAPAARSSASWRSSKSSSCPATS